VRIFPRIHWVIKHLFEALGVAPSTGAPPKKKPKTKDSKHDATLTEEPDDEVLKLKRKEYDSEKIFSRAEVREMFRIMIEVDENLRERLHVLQAACENGWKVVRHLSSINEGKKSHFVMQVET